MELGDDAIALYDRQIRLWGAKAQAKLGSSRVALIGIGALGGEIAKNLVLGGIGSIFVIDNDFVKGDEPTFLVDVKSQVGQKKASASYERLAELNPRVKVESLDKDWSTLDHSFWKQFDIIIGTQLSSGEITDLNTILREFKIPLIVSACHGLYAMGFIDGISTESWETKEKNPKRQLGALDAFSLRELIHYEDIEENGTHWDRCLIKSNFRPWNDKSSQFIHAMYPNERRLIKRVPPLLVGMLSLLEVVKNEGAPNEEQIANSAKQILNDFKLPEEVFNMNEMPHVLAVNVDKEFQPVAAIMGGFISQTVINLLVQREVPCNNFVLLNGLTNEMPVFTI